MTIKRAMYASTLAAGVGLAGLFGVGLSTASANPGQCNTPGQPSCGQDQHNNGPGNNNFNNNNNRDDNHNFNNDNRPGNDNAPANWQGRGVDQGRQDHQSFNWNGQQVNPIPAGNGQGWGFWFGPVWIPL